MNCYESDRNVWVFFSGLRLNRSKTEGMWIGELKHSNDTMQRLCWMNKPVKAYKFILVKTQTNVKS